MSTLDDLRRTLDRHAGDLADRPGTDSVGRTAAVHGRVRAVRRRRRGALAGAAAVVAGALVTSVLAGGGGAPEPAGPDRRLGEVTAPAAIESLGYTYEYVAGEAGADRARLELAASEVPRLVTWSTGSATTAVALEQSDGDRQRWTSTAGDFDDFTLVSPGQEVTVTASGEDAAVALYELAGPPPDGHTANGITFREQTPEARRLGSTIGEPGAAEVSLTVPGPVESLRLSTVCAGAPDAYQHLSVDGVEVMFGPGCDDLAFDPAGQGGITLGPPDRGWGDGGSAELRLWVTDGKRGPLLADGDLRLGLGVYEPLAGQRVLGYAVPEVREFDGHRWQLVGSSGASPGTRSISTTTSPGVPTLTELYWRNAGTARVRGVVDGRQTGAVHISGTGGTTVGDWFRTDGVELGARVRGEAPRVELALVTYERID